MPEESQQVDRPVRVVVLTTDRNGKRLGDAVAVTVPVGELVEIGREGDLQIADDPEDPSVSRIAVSLRTVSEGAMELAVSNLNGVAVHSWGMRTRYVAHGSDAQVLAGRVGLRVIGGTSLDKEDARVYWVLVEGDQPKHRIPLQRSAVTVANSRPVDLTPVQLATVQTVFAEHLAWPPLPTPMSLPIDAAAKRFGVAAAAINERLAGVRKKANGLGMAQQFGVADPEYVHVLVANGYLEPPNEPIDAEDLELFV